MRCSSCRSSSHPHTRGAARRSSSRELVATFGLVSVIAGARARAGDPCRSRWARTSPRRTGSRARPRLRIPRSRSRARCTDTFSGIRPADVPAFVAVQVVGAAAAGEPLALARARRACAAARDRDLRLRAQRRSLADGRGVLQRGSRIRHGCAPRRPARSPRSACTRKWSVRWRSSASTCTTHAPEGSPTSSRAEPSCSSRWAAEKPARSFPGSRRLDWELRDPKGRPPDEVREIRDDVRAHVEALVARERWSR